MKLKGLRSTNMDGEFPKSMDLFILTVCSPPHHANTNFKATPKKQDKLQTLQYSLSDRQPAEPDRRIRATQLIGSCRGTATPKESRVASSLEEKNPRKTLRSYQKKHPTPSVLQTVKFSFCLRRQTREPSLIRCFRSWSGMPHPLQCQAGKRTRNVEVVISVLKRIERVKIIFIDSLTVTEYENVIFISLFPTQKAGSEDQVSRLDSVDLAHNDVRLRQKLTHPPLVPPSLRGQWPDGDGVLGVVELEIYEPDNL